VVPSFRRARQAALELFHISRYISVPSGAVICVAVVVKGTTKRQKSFPAASFFYFAYIIAGVLAGPSWKASFRRHLQAAAGRRMSNQSAYIYMVIAVWAPPSLPDCSFYFFSLPSWKKGITPREYKAFAFGT